MSKPWSGERRERQKRWGGGELRQTDSVCPWAPPRGPASTKASELGSVSRLLPTLASKDAPNTGAGRGSRVGACVLRSRAGESQDEQPPLGAAQGRESQGSGGKGWPESQPRGVDGRTRPTEGSAEAGGPRGWGDRVSGPGAPDPEGAATRRAARQGTRGSRRRRNLPRSGAWPLLPGRASRPSRQPGQAGSSPPAPRGPPNPGPRRAAALPPAGPAPPPARAGVTTPQGAWPIGAALAGEGGGGRPRTRPRRGREPMRRRRRRPRRGERARGPAPAAPPRPPRPRPSRPAPQPRAAAGAGRRAGPAPNPPAGPPARLTAPSFSLSRLAQWRRPRRSSNSSTCSWETCSAPTMWSGNRRR